MRLTFARATPNEVGFSRPCQFVVDCAHNLHVKKSRNGRPPISDERVADFQEIYLSLLRMGKTEIEISADADMVSWYTRYRWLADKNFSARWLEA